jgi:hypothetical protein
VAIFKHFNPLILNSTRDTIVSIPSTHVLINLSTWYTSCPQRNVSQIICPPWCNSQVSQPCSLLCGNSHTNCKVDRLALPTSYMSPYNTSPALSIFFENIKVQKLLEDPSYFSELYTNNQHTNSLATDP